MHISAFARYWRSSLSIAVVAASCSAGAIAAPDADTRITLGHAITLHHDEAVLGALPMSQSIRIEVALKMRNRAALDAFIASAAQNRVGGRTQAMSRAQFLANHAPTQEQAKLVTDYLTSMGYRNVVISPDRLLVSADGTAATARNAFQTSFAQIRTHDGRIAFANTGDVRIPAKLKESILSVVGLQTVHQAHTLERTLKPDVVHAVATTGHNPIEFPSIYNAVGIPGGMYGSGGPDQEHESVGLIVEGDINQTIIDLNTFTKNSGLPNLFIKATYVGGKSGDTSHTAEWNLDSQTIVGTAGSLVGPLHFFVAPSLSDADLTADYDVAAAPGFIARQDGYSPAINVSVSECELDAQDSGAAAAQDQIFAEALSQNKTFSVAAGDTGSNECGDGATGASWPAASQYVVAVGGTTLNASTTTWSSETAWSDSGGSPSRFEPKPLWQYALNSAPTRDVPDIAFDADPASGALIFVNGKQEQLGGTGLAASIFTGLWARAVLWPGNDVVSYRFGSASPDLYLLPQAAFHDITAGNNGGYSAGVGYDFASGRGSMNLGKTMPLLGQGVGTPPVAAYSSVADELKVQFTDHSTSSDGRIVGHFWLFNDGSPGETAVNPVHVFPGEGPYFVTEYVSDSFSNIALVENTVTVAAPGLPDQLIANPGFENFGASWKLSPNVLCGADPANDCVRAFYSGRPHGGFFFAQLDGYGQVHTDSVMQEITIPPGKTSATLAFWLQVSTDEITQTRAFDKLTVGVYGPKGELLAILATYSNLDASDDYQLHTCDLTPWIGQIVQLRFIGKEDSSLATQFLLDDVTVQVK